MNITKSVRYQAVHEYSLHLGYEEVRDLYRDLYDRRARMNGLPLAEEKLFQALEPHTTPPLQ